MKKIYLALILVYLYLKNKFSKKENRKYIYPLH